MSQNKFLIVMGIMIFIAIAALHRHKKKKEIKLQMRTLPKFSAIRL
jgi:LPXTG-motif cell wall-anchored protein